MQSKCYKKLQLILVKIWETELLHIANGMLVLPLQGTIWQHPMHKSYDSAISFLDIHSRESLTYVLKEATERISLSIGAKWKQPLSLQGKGGLKHKLAYS